MAYNSISFNKSAKEIVNDSLDWYSRNYPSFRTVISTITPRESFKIDTMAVTKNDFKGTDLLYNPEFVVNATNMLNKYVYSPNDAEYGNTYICNIVKHEIYHIILGHLNKMTKKKYNNFIWNLATDTIINSQIEWGYGQFSYGAIYQNSRDYGFSFRNIKNYPLWHCLTVKPKPKSFNDGIIPLVSPASVSFWVIEEIAKLVLNYLIIHFDKDAEIEINNSAKMKNTNLRFIEHKVVSSNKNIIFDFYGLSDSFKNKKEQLDKMDAIFQKIKIWFDKNVLNKGVHRIQTSEEWYKLYHELFKLYNQIKKTLGQESHIEKISFSMDNMDENLIKESFEDLESDESSESKSESESDEENESKESGDSDSAGDNDSDNDSEKNESEKDSSENGKNKNESDSDSESKESDSESEKTGASKENDSNSKERNNGSESGNDNENEQESSENDDELDFSVGEDTESEIERIRFNWSTSKNQTDVKLINSVNELKHEQWTYLLQKKIGKSHNKNKKQSTIFRPDKRWGELFPGKKKNNIGAINIAIDTSGSVSKKILSDFFEELIKYSKKNKKVTYNLVLYNSIVYDIIFDWKVKDGMPNIQKAGTDFHVAINALYHLYKDNQGFNIMFTDGECECPSKSNYSPDFANNLSWVIWPKGEKGRGKWGDIISMS